MRHRFLLAIALLGCGPPDPSGAFLVTATRTAGSCPDDRQGPRPLVVDGTPALHFLGVSGSCPLTEADGAWVAKCDLAGGAASSVWRLTFTDAGFWGVSWETYYGPRGLLCYGEFAWTGTRLR